MKKTILVLMAAAGVLSACKPSHSGVPMNDPSREPKTQPKPGPDQADELIQEYNGKLAALNAGMADLLKTYGINLSPAKGGMVEAEAAAFDWKKLNDDDLKAVKEKLNAHYELAGRLLEIRTGGQVESKKDNGVIELSAKNCDLFLASLSRFEGEKNKVAN